MSDKPDFDELAQDLVDDASQEFEQSREEQAAFLDAVADEEGAEVLETTASIKGHSVPVSARLNGDVMDAMGRIDSRLERIEREEARAYEVSDTADDVAQLLADVTDDPALTKREFYRQYEAHGIDPLGVVLEEVFSALKTEKERREGAADGFRKK